MIIEGKSVEDRIEEGRQEGDNWKVWFNKLRNDISPLGPRGSGKYTLKEIKDYMTDIKVALKHPMTGIESGVLETALRGLNEGVRWHGNKLTEENVGDKKIIREVSLTDDGKKSDFPWNGIPPLLIPLRKEGHDDEADWIQAVIDYARSKEATGVMTFKIGRKFDPFAKVSLRKYDGRESYYDYWEDIASHYKKDIHHDFLNSLKKDIQANSPRTTYQNELMEKIESLLKIDAPKTVVEVKPMQMSGDDKEVAVLDAFLERISDKEDNVWASFTEGTTTGAVDDKTGQSSVTTTIEGGTKSNLTPDEKEKLADEQGKIADEAEELARQFEKVTSSTIDPLLYFAVQEGKVAVPFSDKDFDAPRLLEGMEEMLYAIDPEAWDEFQEFINELDESRMKVRRPKYFLPITDINKMDKSGKMPKGGWERFSKDDFKGATPGSKEWENWFDDLGEIAYAIPRRFSITQPAVEVGMGGRNLRAADRGQSGAKAAIEAMGRATKISFPQEKPPESEEDRRNIEMSDTTFGKFNDLVKEILTYYIEPSGSQYYYEGKPRYSELASFSNLIMSAEDSKMKKRYDRIHEGHVDNFGPDDMDPISDFIEAAKNPIQGLKGGEGRGLMRLGKQAARGLDKILGKDSDNKQFIGATLYEIANYHTSETDVIKWQGKSLDDWHELDEDSPNQVLHDIHEFMESTPIKTNLRIRDTTKPIQDAKIMHVETGQSKDSVLGESKERKMFESVKRLITLITELKKSAMDPISMKLLFAHDMIRKMTGQKLSYGRLNVDDPNDISEIMDKVSVTAPEILKIVKSYDSHKNLSLNHGISENEVYLIKGMFR